MVDRYDLNTDNYGGCDMCDVSVEEDAKGDYVLYEDYAKLEAENGALRNRISNALKSCEDLRNDLL